MNCPICNKKDALDRTNGSYYMGIRICDTCTKTGDNIHKIFGEFCVRVGKHGLLRIIKQQEEFRLKNIK